MSRENRRHQSRKKQEKKERQRARAATQRLRNKGRSALRTEKTALRELENTEPSEANIAFAEGLPVYREFKKYERLQLLAEKVYQVYEQAPKNKFYVKVYNRPISTLEFVRRIKEGRIKEFDILYKGNKPNQDFYFRFDEDEDEDYETHHVYYYIYAAQHAPFLYFDDALGDEMTFSDKLDLSIMWDYKDDRFIVDDPLSFLKDNFPRFKKALDDAFSQYAVYQQKLLTLRERGLEKSLEAFREMGQVKTKKDLPENIEATIRSILSRRPLARNYSGVTNNFSRINTSLFN